MGVGAWPGYVTPTWFTQAVEKLLLLILTIQ
jgi:hypothetical protein